MIDSEPCCSPWQALELSVINTSDPATLFKMYQVNRRCRSLVCSTVQQQLLRHLQGILPHSLHGGLPFTKLKWLLTCAGSSTLNQPQVIEALLQLLDPLNKGDALKVIQIAAGAGVCMCVCCCAEQLQQFRASLGSPVQGYAHHGDQAEHTANIHHDHSL